MPVLASVASDMDQRNTQLRTVSNWLVWSLTALVAVGIRAGINIGSATTDFAVGPSLALRGIVVTPLLYFARDLRLTQGLYVGEQLGSSPPPSAQNVTGCGNSDSQSPMNCRSAASDTCLSRYDVVALSPDLTD